MSGPIPKALFLDRDGTLIRWVHYLSDPNQVELLAGVSEALRLAKAKGCLLFLHTNQSGVGRGYFGRDAVDAVNERMCELMGIDLSFFDEVCIATDAPTEAGEKSYRKPSPRFEREMMDKYSLDPAFCYMVGDSQSDLDTGINAGMNSILVPSEQTKRGGILDNVTEYTTVAALCEDLFNQSAEVLKES